MVLGKSISRGINGSLRNSVGNAIYFKLDDIIDTEIWTLISIKAKFQIDINIDEIK